jgi:hypothetical protein
LAIEREGISIPDPITPELQPGDEVVVRDADWIERVWREFSGTGVVRNMKKLAGQSLTIKKYHSSTGVRYKSEHIARYTNYCVEHNYAFAIDPGEWYWNELIFEPAVSFAPESDKMVSALYDDVDLPEFDPLEVLTEAAEKATEETG